MDVTNTSVNEVWREDLLKRRQDAEFLQTFLARRISERMSRGEIGSYVLNLDAGWGVGKTFFLTRFRTQLREAGHIAVYVNAWRDDHAEDPMLSVMAAVDDEISPMLVRATALRKAWRIAKQAGLEIAAAGLRQGAKAAAKRLLGEGIDEISRLAGDAAADLSRMEDVGEGLISGVETLLDQTADAALKAFRREEASITTFKDQLGKLLAEIEAQQAASLPIFILVDELDRCRPTYAIKLLERIKHLFEVSRVAFVIATDSQQLRHSIKAVYGDTFDSAAYLRRFFDRTYQFESPKLGEFLSAEVDRIGFPIQRFSLPEPNEVVPFVQQGTQAFGLSLRDAQQCLDIMHTVATVWTEPVPIEMAYLFPLVIAFQQADDEFFGLLADRRFSELKAVWDSRIRGWRFLLRISDDQRFTTRDEPTDVVDYVVDLLRLISQPFAELVRQQPASGRANVIWQSLIDELRKAHASRTPPSLKSVVRSYPELVRNAGRLTMRDL